MIVEISFRRKSASAQHSGEQVLGRCLARTAGDTDYFTGKILTVFECDLLKGL